MGVFGLQGGLNPIQGRLDLSGSFSRPLGEDLWVLIRSLWILWTCGGDSNNRSLVRKMGTVEMFHYIWVHGLCPWSVFSPFHSQGTHTLIILCVPYWPSQLHFMELKRFKMEK